MFWWTSWTPFNFDISVKFSWIQIEFLKPKSLSSSKHNPYTSPVFCVRKLNHKYQDAYHVNTKRICSNHHLNKEHQEDKEHQAQDAQDARASQAQDAQDARASQA